MKTNEELIVEQFGDGNMLKYFKMEIEHILSQIHRSKEYKICFIDNQQYNAKVKTDGDLTVIEINIGVIMQIYHLAFLIMMSDIFFPELSGGEAIDQMELLDFELPRIELREDNFKEINFYSGPSDPIRVAVAQVIAMFGIEFVIFHEMGHILGGHLEYIKNTLGIHELLAQGSDQIISERIKDNITYQTIEMDADAIAVHLLLENALCKREHIIDVFLKGHKMNLSKLIMVAVVIAFFLMDSNSVSGYQFSKYLPRDYRFNLVLSKLLSKLKKEYCLLSAVSIVDVTDIVKIFIDCNDYLAKLFHSQKICEIPETKLNQYYFDVILEKWKIIRADVQNYASINLPK